MRNVVGEALRAHTISIKFSDLYRHGSQHPQNNYKSDIKVD